MTCKYIQHLKPPGPQVANSHVFGCVAVRRESIKQGKGGAHCADVGGKRGQHLRGAGGSG